MAVNEDGDKKERAAATFVLAIKEKHKLTQMATQGVIEGTTNLNQVTLACMWGGKFHHIVF